MKQLKISQNLQIILYRNSLISQISLVYMNFNDIFLMVGISTISGIVGGLVVVWFFKGISFGDKGIRFDNKRLTERYFLKYSFILSFLIIMTYLMSKIIFYFNEIENTTILINSLFVGSLILVILVILLRYR